MQFDDFEDFDDESVMFGQGQERKTIADYEDKLAGHEDLLEAKFVWTNSKESKRSNDVKVNKANKWKLRS